MLRAGEPDGWLASSLVRIIQVAIRFVSSGWDVKALLREIVTSATYRQSSDAPETVRRLDPLNLWLSRGPRFNLEAEMVRDQTLFASGLLDKTLFGRPVMPWIPVDSRPSGVNNTERWIVESDAGRYRRSLYTLQRRTVPQPAAAIFDAPSGETCTIRRVRTNTPLQALTSLNDPTLLEAAQALARKTAFKYSNDIPGGIRLLVESILQRQPSVAETQRLERLFQHALSAYRLQPLEAARLKQLSDSLYEDRRRQVLLDESVRTLTARGKSAHFPESRLKLPAAVADSSQSAFPCQAPSAGQSQAISV
jgi:hypothetical protein